MINISCDAYLSAAVPISPGEMVKIAEKIISGLGIDDPSMDILVTHDGPMKDLNKKFLNMEGPTNVLSFPDQENNLQGSLGQLVVNVDAIKRESCLYGQDPFSYLVRLMVHGILHLAGFEHGELMDDTADGLMSLAGMTV